MSAICNTSLRWIYGELIRDKKIIELLFDAEFFCAFFHVNFISWYNCINSQELKRQNVSQMCHDLSNQKSYTEVYIRQSYQIYMRNLSH